MFLGVVRRVELQNADLSGYGTLLELLSGPFSVHTRVLAFLLRRHDGHKARVEVHSQYAAQLRLIQVALFGVEHGIRVFLDQHDRQGVARDRTEEVVH